MSTILKRKLDYLTAFEENADKDRKRLCLKSPLEELNVLVWEWFQKARATNIPVSGPLLQEKALEFGKELKVTDFKASNGWLECFRKHHAISFSVIIGESVSVPENICYDWKAKLQDLISGYDQKDVFNMDETGVFFRALPDKTLVVKGQDCKGGKRSKERITVVMCCNMDGQFVKPLVIGKAERPRCFRNLDIKTLPVTWRNNKKAWMTSKLFTSWLADFNRQMRLQSRHVLLFLDNAPSHPKDQTYSNVKLHFFPANTTSKLQPLDQGIIKCMKSHYLKRLLRKVISKVDQLEEACEIAKSVTVYDACLWIAQAQNCISEDTVRKCFGRCGFLSDPDTDFTVADFVSADNELKDIVKLTSTVSLYPGTNDC